MTFIPQPNYRQLPSVWEMAQPFNIDATGAVAFDLDPVRWARNHIVALLMTSPGERVMRPTYGVGMFNFVWENDDLITEQNIITSINNQLAAYEPNITIIVAQFVPQTQYSGVVLLQLDFTVGQSPTVHGVSVNLSGTAIEVSRV
jgi:uncharacterized protein